MKLLLDENLPRKLKNDLSHYEVYSVQDVGWNGKENEGIAGTNDPKWISRTPDS